MKGWGGGGLGGRSGEEKVSAAVVVDSVGRFLLCYSGTRDLETHTRSLVAPCPSCTNPYVDGEREGVRREGEAERYIIVQT